MAEPVKKLPPDPDSSGVAVLDRTFALLGAFGPDAECLTLTELSMRTGLYKSTVLRLLAALEHGGFVRKLVDGSYTVGPQPLRLAKVYQGSFRVGHVIEPLLKQLSAASGETASFYVRHRDMRVALFRVEPTRGVRAAVSVGAEYPVGQGASGKVLSAFSADHAGKLGKVRAQLWATSYGEREHDTASIAAPVFGSDDELQGALALSGPRQRLTPPGAMLTACRQVLRAAADATTAFGGDASALSSRSRSLSRELFG